MNNKSKSEAGYFAIARESADFSFEDFVSRYYNTEQPVIIEGVGESWPAKQRWTETYIRQALAKETKAEAASLWYWMERDMLSGDYQTPELVQRLLDASNTFTRSKSMRIWVHNQDNVSSWHFDGNMVSVFNTQVTGQKEWFLVSPDTPLHCYPFVNFAIMNGNDAKSLIHKRYTHFMLNEGDMLYIPPLWFHKVISKAPENISLNWIMTKKETTVCSKTLNRELEKYRLQEYLFKHRFAWVKRTSKMIDVKLPGFLRSNWRYQSMIITQQPQRRFGLARYVLEELSALGRTLWHARKARSYYQQLKPVKQLDKADMNQPD
ncbi:cupin-like domain-containing protein [Neptunomonas phycophila]|uniref:cupin-like domain-containing protein n=1 Tax=Neptunomonas phycophila TaxID=1572645 RepID=UPI0026E38343|nr:cupin-like domain-containing protein [Neptunomonas phycophila]MDO6468382.1 cupin-like domain-containing protein [Neptunomonas phycophila]